MCCFDRPPVGADFPGRVLIVELLLPVGTMAVNNPPRFAAMHAAFHDLVITSPTDPRRHPACDCVRTSARGRPPAGGRWLEPTREKVHIDDLKNPEYRKGRRKPAQERKAEPLHRPVLADKDRRARFAEQTASTEFGRFYWNDQLGRRMQQELEKSRWLKREAAEQARRRKRNGAGR